MTFDLEKAKRVALSEGSDYDIKVWFDAAIEEIERLRARYNEEISRTTWIGEINSKTIKKFIDDIWSRDGEIEQLNEQVKLYLKQIEKLQYQI